MVDYTYTVYQDGTVIRNYDGKTICEESLYSDFFQGIDFGNGSVETLTREELKDFINDLDEIELELSLMNQ